MKYIIAAAILIASTQSFADTISEDKAISIHGHACSSQAGFTKTSFNKNIQVDFDDVFMEYNISSTSFQANGSALVCKTSVSENGMLEEIILDKLQAK